MRVTDYLSLLSFIATMATSAISIFAKDQSRIFLNLSSVFLVFTVVFVLIAPTKTQTQSKPKYLKFFHEKTTSTSPDSKNTYKKSSFGCFTCVLLTLAICSSMISLYYANTQENIPSMQIYSEIPQTTYYPQNNSYYSSFDVNDFNRSRIAAGSNFTIAIKNDGRVVCTNREISTNTINWFNVKSVAAYGNHALGLIANGTVVFSGINSNGEGDVKSWSDIKQIATCQNGSIGLTVDGEILYAGDEQSNFFRLQSGDNPIKIFGGGDRFAALTLSGKILLSSYRGVSKAFEYILEDDGFYQICLTKNAVLLLNINSSVYSFSIYDTDGYHIIEWENIIAIAGGERHTVGLKKDGTVVAAGDDFYGQCDVDEWTDIVAICAGQFHTVGLKSDGTLVATGLNDSGQCNVEGIDLW